MAMAKLPLRKPTAGRKSSSLHEKIEELEELQHIHDQARKALFDSEQEKSAILNAMFECVVLTDRDFRILWTNGAVNRRFQSRPEDLTGKLCHAVFFDSSRPCPYCPTEEVRKSGRPRTIRDVRFLGKRWNTCYYPIGDSGSVLGVYSDITEQKEVEEALLEEKRQKERVERELLEIGEKERRILGQELHDGLGQLLTGIALKARVIARNLEKQNLPGREDAERLTDLANEAIGQTKQLIRGLIPAGLGSEGILEALRELSRNIGAIYGTPCLIEADGAWCDLDGVAADQLYRIAREAALNAAKHSGAKEIVIRLRGQNGRGILLSVEDDGIGFSVGEKETEGMGLGIMDHRAKMIDASFRIEPKNPKGTVVTCRFVKKEQSRPQAAQSRKKGA